MSIEPNPADSVVPAPRELRRTRCPGARALRAWGGACAAACWLFTLGAAAEPAATAPITALSWHERYEQARVDLIASRSQQAAREFDALADAADNAADRQLAREMASVARAQQVEQSRRLASPELRTSDELAVLYTTAVFYGLGTSGWLTLQLKPQSFGGALLPFAVLTPASVGIVALADNYRPLRHGIPQSIAAGLYLGFGEGLWITGYQHAYAANHDSVDRWGSSRVSTVLWAGSSAGALVGGLIGAWRRPTPGRVSFTASAGIWGGVLSSFAASAFEPERKRRGESAYLVGAIGYNVGLVAGIVLGPTVAPQIARVRFLDLGGLFGALLGGGGYALISNSKDSRGSLASAAIGGVVGLGLAWWATSGMAPDHSHDSLRPAIGSRASGLSTWRPTLAPTPGGFLAGVTGQL